MPTEVPAHKPEHTGNTVLDRIQNCILGIIAFLRSIEWMRRRSFVGLTTDVTQVVTAGYNTLLTASIVTANQKSNLLINFSASGVQLVGNSSIFFEILVDEVAVKGCCQTVTGLWSFTMGMVALVPVSIGGHVVKLKWRTNTNTSRIFAFTDVEEHAYISVEEMAS